MERLGDLTVQYKRRQEASKFVRLAQQLLKNVNRPRHLMLADDSIPHDIRHYLQRTAVSGADTTSSGWASELAAPGIGEEWVNLLDQRTLIGRIPFKRADFGTRTLGDSPGSAAWVGEGVGVPLSRLTLDEIVNFDRKKIVGMVVFSKESVQLATPASLSHINSSMTNTVGRYTDRALLDPALAESSGVNPPSLTNGVTPIASTGSTEAAVTADVKSLLQAHVDAGADLRDVTIAMHPDSALHLSTLLTSGGARAFPNVGVNGGDMFGVPVLTSMGAYSSGSPSERVIAAINAQGVLLADDGIGISATDMAALQMDDAPTNKSIATATGTTLVSMFQTETIALKFVRWLNFRAATGAVSWMPVSY